MNKIKQYLLYAGLDKTQFREMLPQAWRDNARWLRIYSLLATLVFAGLMLVNFFFFAFATRNQGYYIAMTVANAAIYIATRLWVEKRPVLAMPLAYLFMAALYAFSLGVTSLHPEYPAVSTIVLLFAVPFIITDRPIRMVCMTGLVTVALIGVGYMFKPRDIAHVDMWNALSFAEIAMVVEVLQQVSRFRSLFQAKQIDYLSKTDLLTGAKNRNHYEHSLREYAQRCKTNMVCVYADVNGLHELNDSQGHRAGDLMLQTVAAALTERFGAENTFRIGGDEFVAYCPDKPEADVQKEVKDACASLLRRGYYVSAGVASADKQGLDMAALTAEAEKGMYLEKQAYYQQSGRDRRRR